MDQKVAQDNRARLAAGASFGLGAVKRTVALGPKIADSKKPKLQPLGRMEQAAMRIVGKEKKAGLQTEAELQQEKEEAEAAMQVDIAKRRDGQKQEKIKASMARVDDHIASMPIPVVWANKATPGTTT